MNKEKYWTCKRCKELYNEDNFCQKCGWSKRFNDDAEGGETLKK